MPLRVEFGRPGSGFFYQVPAGFAFDVSAPWWSRWWVDPHDRRLHRAAALHDHALAAGWQRVAAAALFSEALRADGVGRVKRLAMVLAVIVRRFR
ncbi:MULTISPECIES: DUF1353 domain-containing protein [Sulfitobacter]|uniref:DUF1353 domain-containing protein n=1 Tax=Sulfitobacter profundi TaxID=2679961 RepID=A0ABW1YXW2_9RHOB|nr:DUF1353 domain-containing protein [Sulfitobacter indolifex]